MRNGLGVVGVAAEKARIYAYNIFGWWGSFYESDLLDAWDWCLAELDRLKSAVDPDMKLVVSMSVGGPGPPAPEIEAELNAHYARGDVLFVAAAGNDGTSDVSYPAGYTAVVSVAATAWDNSVAWFSQYNYDVEMAAPGVHTLSTFPWPGDAFGGPSVVTDPPPLYNATDDNLQSPPLTIIEGSALGVTVTGARPAGRALGPPAACRVLE